MLHFQTKLVEFSSGFNKRSFKQRSQSQLLHNQVPSSIYIQTECDSIFIVEHTRTFSYLCTKLAST